MLEAVEERNKLKKNHGEGARRNPSAWGELMREARMSPNPVLPSSGPAGLFTPPTGTEPQPVGCCRPLLPGEQAQHRRGLDVEVWRREFWSPRS